MGKSQVTKENWRNVKLIVGNTWHVAQWHWSWNLEKYLNADEKWNYSRKSEILTKKKTMYNNGIKNMLNAITGEDRQTGHSYFWHSPAMDGMDERLTFRPSVLHALSSWLDRRTDGCKAWRIFPFVKDSISLCFTVVVNYCGKQTKKKQQMKIKTKQG